MPQTEENTAKFPKRTWTDFGKSIRHWFNSGAVEIERKGVERMSFFSRGIGVGRVLQQPINLAPEEPTKLAPEEAPTQVTGGANLEVMVLEVAAAAIRREGEEERAEAGDHSLGFSVPAWEIGPQRYGDPGLWRPDTPTALTEDEEYGQLYEVAQQIDRR
jgi:hypothetical protein